MQDELWTQEGGALPLQLVYGAQGPGGCSVLDVDMDLYEHWEGLQGHLATILF